MGLVQIIATIGPVLLQFFYTSLLPVVSRYIFPKLKTRRANVLFHLITGLFVTFTLYGPSTGVALAEIFIEYFIISLNPWVCFGLSFGLNTLMHIRKLLVQKEVWALNITATAMISFHKFIATSWNLYDGKKLKEGKKIKRPIFEKLALDEKPPLLEWFAFCICPYGGNTGPTYEFKVFDWMLEQYNRPQPEMTPVMKKRIIECYVQAVFAAIFTILGLSVFSFKRYYSSTYLTLPLVLRVAVMLVLTLCQAIKYFCVWDTIEGGLVAMGIDECPCVEDRSYSNLFITDVLQSCSSGEWIQRWNHTAHIMWKRYLFYRVLEAGYPYFLANLSVFASSAFWHGFSWNYYLVVPELMVAIMCDKRLQKLNPVDHGSPLPKRLLRHAWVIFQMFASTSTWWSGTLESFIYVRKITYWSGFLCGIIMLAVCEVILRVRGQKKPPMKEEKKTKSD